jgi:hypothetical protein
MEPEKRTRETTRTIWGLFLIALGALLLIERFGPWAIPNIRQFWPAVLFALAVIRLTEGRPGGALIFAGLGTWFFAAEFHWYGLDWGNSWPLALVAVGLGIVVRALTGEDRRRLRRLGVDLD